MIVETMIGETLMAATSGRLTIGSSGDLGTKAFAVRSPNRPILRTPDPWVKP
jgi:hypothetical protein